MVASLSQNQSFASNPEIQVVIDWLLSQHLPPLPVAPRQNLRECPKVVKTDSKKRIWQHCPLDENLQPIPLYTGKNPSFLDRHGVPHLINHRQYQFRLPSALELREWFANPLNGIGTLGGHGGVVWLDFDVKQFDSEVECSRAVKTWGEFHPELKGTFCERTHSGGWRVGVRVKQDPDFTNFALSPGGNHVGESLGKGRFTVLSPTVGVSGNSYRSINRTSPVEVDSLEAIGIYSSKSNGKTLEVREFPKPNLLGMPGSIPLDMLLTDQAKAILSGNNPTRDRSESLTILAREAYGWENWAGDNDVLLRDNTKVLAHAAGAALGIDSNRVERILKTIDPANCHPAAEFRGESSSCWLKLRRLDKATFEAKCPVDIKKEIASRQASSLTSHSGSKAKLSVVFPSANAATENQTVTCDSFKSGDSSNDRSTSITGTVTAVTAILGKGLKDWEEQDELDKVQAESSMSKTAFTHLVSAQRCQLNEVTTEDKKRFDQLVDWRDTTLDYNKAVPHLAEDLLHDGAVLNIDPIMIWQYLFPSILSLFGKKGDLDIQSHKIPAIAWTCSVAESGTGESRVENLVLAPLRDWQAKEYQRFKHEWEEYQAALKESKKDDNSNEKPEPPSPERKYLFEVATIQAVMRRLSEQAQNGSIWGRDEISGLFKSLGQFASNGEGEGLECLLKMWDGSGVNVDRIMREDSYVIGATRLSVSGGLQPGIFRKIFKDPDDANGMQARFLFAAPKVQPAKRVKGGCRLAEKLPEFYRWVDQEFPEGTIKLSRTADARYEALYEQTGTQAEQGKTAAIRFWHRKLPSQLLRIALALHIIECYHEQGRLKHEVQLDTLNRAVEFARYYCAAFQLIQESTADSDNISGILMKIWDLAVTTPDGLPIRDAYRGVKAIQRRAKELGRNSAAYTLDLYGELEKMGRGTIKKVGRQARFLANSNLSQDAVTLVTVSEKLATQQLKVSPQDEVSPVTVSNKYDTSIDDGSKTASKNQRLPESEIKSEFSEDVGDEWLDYFEDRFEEAAQKAPHTESAIAPQPAPEPQQATLNLAAKSESESSALGDSVEVWQYGEWKPAILLQRPNNHSNPQQRLSGWRVRLDTGQEFYVWSAEELRLSGGEP